MEDPPLDPRKHVKSLFHHLPNLDHYPNLNPNVNPNPNPNVKVRASKLPSIDEMAVKLHKLENELAAAKNDTLLASQGTPKGLPRLSIEELVAFRLPSQPLNMDESSEALIAGARCASSRNSLSPIWLHDLRSISGNPRRPHSNPAPDPNP